MSTNEIRQNCDFDDYLMKIQNVSSLDSDSSNFNIYLEKTYSTDARVLLAVKKLNSSIKYLKNLSDVNLLKKNDILITTVFEELAVKKPCFKILGRTALLELAENPNGLLGVNRYRYCNALVGAIISITGIYKRDEMIRLLNLIGWMGGNFQPNVNYKSTHLVSGYACSNKSQYANIHEIPVVGSTWIHAAWEKRNEIHFTAIKSSFFLEYNLKPFHGAKICFSGFTEEEKSHMVDVLLQNGGTPIDDEHYSESSHMVVNESLLDLIPPVRNNNAEIVKEAWFWTTVQYQGCALTKEYLLTNLNVSKTPTSAHVKSSTQKRTHATTSGKASPTNSPGPSKRLLSNTITLDSFRLSCDSSSTNNPDHPSQPNFPENPDLIIKDEPISPRYRIFSELLQTEKNYVGALNTIITVYKEPLEKMMNNKDYLNVTGINYIFGNVLPIYKVHCEMLEELINLATPWQEDNSIGKVFLKYSSELVKVYPPFVNFFEKTREILLHCDQAKPRFHAFLKVSQTRPECYRQSLKELLIRPVQRLPSVSLLLNDILKHSNKNNPDHQALVSAIASIRDVMTYINEDKRKTEGQTKLFDIFNDIDNCPKIVSSHRSFITECDVIELSDNLSGRGDHLTIFVFSDVVEVCKKRKYFNEKKPKEPNSSLHKSNIYAKPYKHIKLMPLNIIRQVIDIKETEGYRNAFSLIIVDNHDFKEQLYTFTMIGSSCSTNNKIIFLKNISQQVDNIVCSGNILVSLDSQQLDTYTILYTNDTTATLGKAFEFASRTYTIAKRVLNLK